MKERKKKILVVLSYLLVAPVSFLLYVLVFFCVGLFLGAKENFDFSGFDGLVDDPYAGIAFVFIGASCLLASLANLSIFFNLIETVRKNFWLSLVSFLIAPACLILVEWRILFYLPYLVGLAIVFAGFRLILRRLDRNTPQTNPNS